MKLLHSKLISSTMIFSLLSACGGSGDDSSDNSSSSRLNPEDIGNYIFVSSEVFNGDLDGLSGADLKCHQLAEASAYAPAGSYKAWLSGYNTDASARLPHSDQPYVKYDASSKTVITIANNWTDLTDGSLKSAINYNEKGQQVTTSLNVWSNSDASGSKLTSVIANTCQDYSDSTLNGLPSGQLDALDLKWTNSGSTLDCGNEARLYCFYTNYWYLDSDGDGYGNPSSEISSDIKPGNNYIKKPGDCNDSDANINPNAIEIFNGKDDNCDGDTDHASYYVFATSLTYTADFGGLDNADHHCQTLADLSTKMPTGVYKAWLSDSIDSPSNRFTRPNVNYVRYDINNHEQVVANGWSDLTDGSLDLPIARDQYGNNVDNSFAWTNTNTNGDKIESIAANICNDWTDSFANFFVVAGDTNESGQLWTVSDKNCGASYRFYCFQQ